MPASTLLDPVFKPSLCPLAEDRFELRTKTLGCGCSTTTLLSIIISVVATLFAILILYSIFLCARFVNRVYGTGSRCGWELGIADDGGRRGKLWARPTWTLTFGTLFQRKDLTHCSEQDQTTERSRLLRDS